MIGVKPLNELVKGIFGNFLENFISAIYIETLELKEKDEDVITSRISLH